jgi:tetratricopeptide (TPR) repeat protein
MKLLAALGLAAALLGAAAPSQQVADAEALEAALMIWPDDDCQVMVRNVEPLLARADARFSGQLRAEAHLAASRCLLQTGDMAGARRHAHAGTALTDAPSDLWHQRLVIDLRDGMNDSAMTTIETMAKTRPDALGSVPSGWFGTFDRELRDRPDLHRRLLVVLLGPAYKPDESWVSLDGLRVEYAALLLADGDRAGATAMIRAVVDPYAFTEVSVDERFRDMLPRGFDERAMAERMLARTRDFVAAHPDVLAPLLDAAALLRRLGRPQQSLDLLESVGGRLRGEGTPFTDAAANTAWWWDGMARSYRMLGRFEDGVAALARGAEFGEGNRPNVSQAINLAGAQIEMGRPREALKTLAVFEDGRDASPYGKMALRFVRGCASARTGDTAAAAADLAYVRAHEKDGRAVLGDLLLCMGDLDGAAANFIRRLDDPASRVRMLLQLSDYPPLPQPPADPLAAGLAALKARPDVQAAIARAGGTRRFAIHANET